MQQTKTTKARLEGFVDWMRVVDSELAKKEEMFTLVVGFATLMRKRPVALEGEATSSSREKRPMRSPSNVGDSGGLRHNLDGVSRSSFP